MCSQHHPDYYVGDISFQIKVSSNGCAGIRAGQTCQCRQGTEGGAKVRAGILSCCLSVMSIRCQLGIEQCHKGLTYRLQGSGSLPTSICAAEDCHPPPTKGRGTKALHATPAVQGVMQFLALKALPAACFYIIMS